MELETNACVHPTSLNWNPNLITKDLLHFLSFFFNGLIILECMKAVAESSTIITWDAVNNINSAAICPSHLK